MTRCLLLLPALLSLTACGKREIVASQIALQGTGGGAVFADEGSMQDAIEDEVTVPFDTSAVDPTPARDDAAEQAIELDETDAAPGVADDLAADAADPLPAPALEHGAFFVRLQWGHLVPKADGAPIDFSGNLAIDADDAFHRVRAWRFETKDVIERPRPNAYTVNVDSRVSTRSDGLHAVIVAKGGATSLTITLGEPLQFSKTYAIDASTLHVREVTAATESGMQVRVAIDRIHPKRDLPCDVNGKLLGRWLTKTAPDGRPISVLVARVFNEEGKVVAKVGGVAGERRNGDGVVFMKIVGKNGRVALVKGRYDSAAKTFSGDLLNAERATIGSLGGSYALAEDPTAPGTFEGMIDADRCE